MYPYPSIAFLFISFSLANADYADIINEYKPATGPWYIQTQGEPWPLPQVYESDPYEVHVVDRTYFHFTTNHTECSILMKAMSRYQLLIFGNDNPPNSERTGTLNAGGKHQIQTVEIKLLDEADCNDFPGSRMNETYVLNTTLPKHPVLEANQVWGALRGLETLSQLIFEETGTLKLRQVYIHDWPRFSFRGLMLDTSRHFISVDKLKETLNIMEHNKFNVFHWHITDDQSFPYQSVVFPDFSAKSSFHPVKAIYRISQIRDIIYHARDRGIRVIPEFDTPGHTSSWVKAMPEIGVNCSNDVPPGEVNGLLNPFIKMTYKVVGELFSEVSRVFPDQYFHLGGDEVSVDCWTDNDDLEEFITGQQPEDFESQYIKRVLSMVRAAPINKTAMLWQDVMENSKDIGKGPGIIQIWKGSSWSYFDVELAVQKGFDIIYSSCWYLNYISYGGDWANYYVCDPEKELDFEPILGGETCLWGEFVDDVNLTPRLWPRAAAVAERLWSNKNITSVTEAARRISEHRCRLVKRGYAAQPVTGADYCF